MSCESNESVIWSVLHSSAVENAWRGKGDDDDDTIMASRILRNLLRWIVGQSFILVPCFCLITLQDPKLSIRQMNSQPKNITHALQVLEANSEPTVVVEALRVCGKCKRPDIALATFQKYPSELARTMTISILGACEEHHQAVELIKESSVAAASYNAAIASCAKAKDWKLALGIHNNQIPKEHMTTLTTNTLLSILADCRKGEEALHVITNFHERSNDREPSRVTYQIVIRALIRSKMIDEAFEILKNVIQQSKQDENAVAPTYAMYDMITAAYNKRCDWESVRRVEQLRYPEKEIKLDDIQTKYEFQHWDKLQRVGHGRESYFVVGQVLVPSSSEAPPLNITIGVQPHRNAVKNGIQLEFWENLPANTKDKKTGRSQTKLGFLLMINDGETNTSSMIGMFLTNASRGKGISKVCLAIWMSFCLQASITPTTGKLNKPLIALALQHRFGFVPDKGGVDLELSNANDGNGTLLAYSPKALQGAFSTRDVQNLNMRIVKEPPNPRGRMVSVRTKFQAPANLQDLQDKVNEALPEGTVTCKLNAQDIRRLYFGN
jgi:pentatricopeptide repeat protein